MSSPTDHLHRHKSIQLQNIKKMGKKTQGNPQKTVHHVNPILHAGGKFDDKIKEDHEDDFEDKDFETMIIDTHSEDTLLSTSQFATLTGITSFFFILFVIFASLYGLEKQKLMKLESTAATVSCYTTTQDITINNNYVSTTEYIFEECPPKVDSDVPQIYRGHNIFSTSYYGVPITLHLYYGANAYKYQDVIVVAPPFGKYAPNAYQILQEQVHLAEALNSMVVVPDFSQTNWTYTEQVLGNVFNESYYDVSGEDWQAILNGEKSSYSHNFDIRLKSSGLMNPPKMWTLGVYVYIMRLSRRFISKHYGEMNWVLYGYGSTGSLTAQVFGLFYSQIIYSKYKPTRYVLEPSDWYIFPTQPTIGSDFFGSGSNVNCIFEDVDGIFTYDQSSFFDGFMYQMENVLDSLTNTSSPIVSNNITLNATACMVAIGAAAFSQPLNQTLLPTVQSYSDTDTPATVLLSEAELCNQVYTQVYTKGTGCKTTYETSNVDSNAPFPYGIGNLKGIATEQNPNNDTSLEDVLAKFNTYHEIMNYMVSLPFNILINGKMTNRYGGYGAGTDNQCDPSKVVFPLPSNSALDYQGAYQLARVTNFFLSGMWWDQYNSAKGSSTNAFNWNYFYCSGLGYNSAKQPHCPSTWMAVTGDIDQLNSYWVNARYGQPYFHFQTYNITLQTHCCVDFWVDVGYLEGCKKKTNTTAYNCEYSGPGRSLNQTLVNLLQN